MTTKELRENIRNRYDQGRYTWFFTMGEDFVVKDKTNNKIYARIRRYEENDVTRRINDLIEEVDRMNEEDSHYLSEVKSFTAT
jgi:hypothetical protein